MDDYSQEHANEEPTPPESGEKAPEEGGGEKQVEKNSGDFTDARYISSDEAPPTPKTRYREQEAPMPAAENRKKSRPGAGVVVALCLLCLLLGTAIGGFFLWTGIKNHTISLKPEAALTEAPAVPEERESAGEEVSEQAETENAAEGEENKPFLLAEAEPEANAMSATDIYAMACEQVVGITTEFVYTNVFGAAIPGAVTGSGFILTQDGYIITNYHVIQRAVEGGYDVRVILYNGESYVADIVGFEGDDNDIAVLKIEAAGLRAVTLGDSGEMKVGQTVYAVGNPLGELSYTMTRGMISAMDREITTTDGNNITTTINMFQIDAAVNSGNSGGPVYDTAGRVIGIVSAKYSDTGVEGLGFAIPISDAVDISNDLIQNGYVSGKPYMGVSVQTVSSAVAQYYSLVEGAYVYALDAEGCAARAGLQAGDIITKIDDKDIKSIADLIAAKKKFRAGDAAKLTVFRKGEGEGEYLEMDIVFDEQKPATDTAPAQGGSEPGGFGTGSGTGW